jgi:hypothetical protein
MKTGQIVNYFTLFRFLYLKKQIVYIKNFNINSTAKTIVTIEISLNLPVNAFKSTNESTPNKIPSEIEYVKGIITIVKKAGIDSVKSSKLIFFTGVIIIAPTKIRAGAVAAPGIIRNIGERNNARSISPATVSEVKPVRPPSLTPAALST